MEKKSKGKKASRNAVIEITEDKAAAASEIKDTAEVDVAAEEIKPVVEENPLFSDKNYLSDGLDEEQVAQRIADGKINGEQTIKTKSVAQILFGNIFTFFNFLFVALAAILVFFEDFQTNKIKNFGFMGLVIINALIGIVQELKAKRTMDKLSLISAPRVKVVRGGVTSDVAVRDVLLDDVTILSTGDQICADAVVIDGSIEVNESLITGEPDAISKSVGDSVMSGSCVVSGKAKARVIHVGMDNFAMKISAGAKYFKKPNSEIWRSLMTIVKVMAAIIVPLGIALFCVKYFLQNGELNPTVVNTIGTLVGMIPNGLAALSSTVFCISVIRLARHKTLAQDMYCVETLARVDVLCLDKTGTITSGEMEVNGLKPRKDLSEPELKGMIRNLIEATQDENATAVAIRNYVKDCAVTAKAEKVVPFSSVRKWSGAYFAGRSYVLGAPEFVLNLEHGNVKDICNEMADRGYRVLAVASSKYNFNGQELPSRLRLEGLIFITDKIRPEAPDTMRFFKEQGVNLKIISGDNPVTVRAVAIRAGLDTCDSIIDMSTVEKDVDLTEIAEKNTIFGRVTPEQKLGLVKALKAGGHTVAMTGDGVNDVLALKESDCSIAMASGSDAAKNVSSLVLLDSNFASLPKVVAEGRRSINNLERSASLFLVKTIYNFLLALVFLIVPSNLPFEPTQLTLIGMVTIGIPSFVLALEPNNERVTGRFMPKVLCNALPGAIMVVIGILLVLATKQFFLPELTDAQMTTMYVLVTVFVGFVYLFKVCLPFNVVHVVLYLFVLTTFVLCHFVTIPGINISLKHWFGLSTDINYDMTKALVVIVLIVLPWFVIMLGLTSKLRKKIDAYLDKRNFSDASRERRTEKQLRGNESVKTRLQVRKGSDK